MTRWDAKMGIGREIGERFRVRYGCVCVHYTKRWINSQGLVLASRFSARITKTSELRTVPERSVSMADILYIVITLVFFAAGAWFIRGYNNLYEEEANV